MSEDSQLVRDAGPEDTPAQDATTEQALLGRVLRNTAWLTFSSLLVRAVNFGRTVVLARLLLPEDFGVFGLANTFIGFTLIFGDVGAGQSAMYKTPLDEGYKSSAFWLNLGIATLLMAGIAACSPFAGAAYSSANLAPVLAALALAFWFQIAGVVHRTLLRRGLHFRSLAFVEIVSSVVLFVSAAGLAWRGYGVWSFVGSLLIANVVTLFLLWRVSGWTPKWILDRSATKEIGTFSGWYLAAFLASYLALGLDRLLIGKFLGMESLGRYVFAFDLALALTGIVVFPLQQVVAPELARLRHDTSRFWRTYVDTSRLAALAVAPAAVVLLIPAGEFIPAIFGDRWTPAVVPFQLLAAFFLARGVLGDPFAALGRYDLSFRLSSAAVIVGCAGILVGMRYGITGVGAAVALVGVAVYVAAVYLSSGSKRELGEILRCSVPYFAVALGAGAVGLAARYFFGRWVSDEKNLLALVTVATALVVYVLAFRRQLRVLVDIFADKEQEKSNGNL